MMPLLLPLAVSACGVTIERPDTGETEWMSRSEFRGYAETVLRRQNAVGNELMFLLPDLEQSDQARYEHLIEAEDQMLAACNPLISRALERRRAAQMGLLDRLRLPRQTVACDRHTTRLERMLEDLESP